MAEPEQPLTWPAPSLRHPELVITVCHYLLGSGTAPPADLSTLKPSASFPEFSPAWLTHSFFHLLAPAFLPFSSPTAAVEAL